MAPLPNLLRRFLRRDDGTATVEFAILVPLLFTVFIAALESGLMMVRWVSIDRATDMVIRDLRLGLYANPTAETLRRDVCDRTFLIENCYINTAVDILRINRTTFDLPPPGTPCVTRDTSIIQPVTDIVPGQQNDLMLIRVCIAVDAMFPTSGYALPIEFDAMGGYALAVSSVYVNEPS
ncbi:pilus assembly protein [Rhodobacteraceae bacterium HSP-20]|uniref:Pilus assembly protein n=1 Tax=Paragemmobacter amnigenus TaxID=2852097 RepID=A0ABS6J635_9RHOB|nr:TadE/TadG family type IV pilus assembly protein [Rhodobacter amnigenus]MBU9699215.1 pilus assembly protein [Rhodobacter amnigenus]MBV4390442.1 pilus assembly protein [Rhodobacter amnigenus]